MVIWELWSWHAGGSVHLVSQRMTGSWEIDFTLGMIYALWWEGHQGLSEVKYQKSNTRSILSNISSCETTIEFILGLWMHSGEKISRFVHGGVIGHLGSLPVVIGNIVGKISHLKVGNLESVWMCCEYKIFSGGFKVILGSNTENTVDRISQCRKLGVWMFCRDLSY